MSFEHRTGDLFAQPDLSALAHGVNCLGAMGAGIAVLFRRRDEEMYRAYREVCETNRLLPGDVFFWQHDDGSWTYNLASQYYLGADARLNAIRESLTKAVAHAEDNGVSAIGLPRIGSDIGGLDWSDVRRVIEKVAETTPVHVVTVSLPDAS